MSGRGCGAEYLVASGPYRPFTCPCPDVCGNHRDVGALASGYIEARDFPPFVDDFGHIANADINKSSSPVSSLVRKLQVPVASVRVSALTVLGKLGKAAAVAEREILATLKDPDIAVRLAATETLGNIGTESPEVARSLLAAFQDPCPKVAENAEFSFRCVLIKICAARLRNATGAV